MVVTARLRTLATRLARLEAQHGEESLDDLARELNAAIAAAKDWAAENEWVPLFPGEPELPLSWRNRAFADALSKIEERVK